MSQNYFKQNVPQLNFGDIKAKMRQHFKYILAWAFGLALLGAVYSLLAPKEFDSKATILPELASSTSLGKIGGGLSALAGLAGVDLSAMSSTEAVRPDLYPNVLESFPFALYMFDQQVYVAELGKKMKLSDYYNIVGQTWYNALLSKLRSKSEVTFPANATPAAHLTYDQEQMLEWLQARVTSDLDRKSGIITINSRMPDGVVAATTAHLSVEYIKEYVKSYRTEKGQDHVKFLTEQVNRAKARYQSAEAGIAYFRDHNRGMLLQTTRIGEQRLQSDYIQAQSIYNSILGQLEQAKIRVAEDTPVLKTLEPARVPLKRSSPKRSLIVIGCWVLGLLIGFALKVGGEFLKTETN